uniref:Uncharacterized protein n=1 Tax=Seriola lalandi dorsalis TaxID=1841481 RepID=A0A3B4X616_SERLL
LYSWPSFTLLVKSTPRSSGSPLIMSASSKHSSPASSPMRGSSGSVMLWGAFCWNGLGPLALYRSGFSLGHKGKHVFGKDTGEWGQQA